MKKKIALYWDIDGTILSTNGVGFQPLCESIAEVFPDHAPITRKACSGKTDYEIIMEAVGLENWDRKEDVEQVVESYNLGLKKNLDASPAHQIGQIEKILHEVRESDLMKSFILSGNNQIGARIKLESVGLVHFFPESDRFLASYEQPRRIDVARLAVTKTKDFTGIVLGDTPHDITVAKEIAVPVIALASGQHSVNELKIWTPSFLLSEPTVEGIFSILDLLN